MSTRSTIPFFGQSWELTVAYQTGDQSPAEAPQAVISTDSWEPEALRITFEVLQSSISSPWGYADIVIYNLNDTDFQSILFGATWVYLKAGFQTGDALSAQIWSGPILQVLYDREGVVDQRVTLHCVYNPEAMTQPLSFSMGVYSSQAQLLAKAAAAINLPPLNASSGTLSPYAQRAVEAKQYPRGNTVFGTLGKHLDTIAGDQFLTTTRDGVQAYLTEISDPDAVIPRPSLIYSPPNPPNEDLPLPAGTSQTVIGTPRQTPTGVIFTVLLDPRIRFQIPIQVVALVRTLPTQTAIIPSPSGGNMGTPLDNNLFFFVSQVKHIGDSRGNEWYTEVTGFTTTYAQMLLTGVFGSSSL